MSPRRSDRGIGHGVFHRLPEALRAHERTPADRRTGPAESDESAESLGGRPDEGANVVPPPVDSRGRIYDDGHGRAADAPGEIGRRGWKDVALRAKQQVKEDNIGLVAAGVAFYSLLALFPALVALISLYGLMVKPSQAREQVAELLTFMPQGSRSVIENQLTSVTQSSEAGLGIGLAVSLVAAIWSASSGMRALMTGLNIAYDEAESRSFVRLRLVSMALTLGAVVLLVVSMAAVVGVPAAFDPSEPVGVVLSWVRWPVLALVMMFGLSVVYRYGPNRDDAKWRWVSWGAVLATLLWVVMSAAFSLYVSSFGRFNETYGTLAGVVVLMLWLSLSAFTVLLGAEVNAELERQTAKDTTRGPERPIGTRNAYAADTVGVTGEELKRRE